MDDLVFEQVTSHSSTASHDLDAHFAGLPCIRIGYFHSMESVQRNMPNLPLLDLGLDGLWAEILSHESLHCVIAKIGENWGANLDTWQYRGDGLDRIARNNQKLAFEWGIL